MASEELTVSVELPRDLVEWLDNEAMAADIDKETMVSQLLASYQAVKEVDGDIEEGSLLVDTNEVAESVQASVVDELEADIEAAVAAEVAEQLDTTVADSVQQQVDELVTDRVTEATSGVQRQLGSRIDSLETEFDEKIRDIRQRVIQLKTETDQKAPADHTHDSLDVLPELEADIDALKTEVTELREQYDETVPDQGERLDDYGERLDEIQDRLQTVAWVVSDLRDAQQSSSGLEAVERIKRAAARADVERANCENCDEGVILSLLTDPHCPHCDATVTNVEPASGWFSDPTLTVASQLESGEKE